VQVIDADDATEFLVLPRYVVDPGDELAALLFYRCVCCLLADEVSLQAVNAGLECCHLCTLCQHSGGLV